MIVAIHQPAYLPWLGYFDRIAASDLFIFLDTVQFERNSFSNRNRIKTASGPIWLTVPVRLRGHMEKIFNQIEIDNTQGWRKKHLRAIEQNYHRAPMFSKNFERLVAIYPQQPSLLSELCYNQLKFWLSELEITTRVVRASELPVKGSKSDLILALCKHVGAKTYLSGPLGRGYLQEDQLLAANVAVHYHDYVQPEYPQLFGDFAPAMSIVDYWMNCGSSGMFRGKR
jgi:hypothetical protein